MSAPDPRLIEGLLVERYPVRGVRVSVDLPAGSRPRIVLGLERPKAKHRPLERYQIDVQYIEGGSPDAIWDLVVDAADALFGTLVESGFAYRELPAGEGVEYGEAKLRVEVSYARPDIDAKAEQLLGSVGED